MDTRDLIDIDEAASLLHVKRASLFRYNMRRKLPFYKLGRKVYYDKADLLAFIESQRVEAAPTAQ